MWLSTGHGARRRAFLGTDVRRLVAESLWSSRYVVCMIVAPDYLPCLGDCRAQKECLGCVLDVSTHEYRRYVSQRGA